MNARTRRAVAIVASCAAGAFAVAAGSAACFPGFEFPDDDGGTAPGSDGAALVPDATTSGNDAGDASVPGDGDASHDGSTAPPTDGGTDAAVDAGILTDAVLLLHLDETSFTGAGAVKDSSGSGNNGSISGNASGVTPTTGGKFGGAALFAGTGWIEIPNSASLALTTKFTLSAWVNYSTALGTNVSPGIIVKRTGFDDASYTLFLWNTNDAVQAYADIEESTRFNSTGMVLPGNWYHLAVVYDGTVPSASMYVNGALSSQATTGVVSSLAANTTPIRVGDLPDGGNTLTNGKIDEVVIWSRALGAAEIQALAAATGPL